MKLSLKNVAEFQRPAGAAEDDPQVGEDDLGMPVYLNRVTGQKYRVTLAEDQRTFKQKVSDFEFKMPTLQQVGEFFYNTVAGTWDVIDTPRAIATGEKTPTLGDAFAVGGMAAVGTLPFSTPKGATRIFGGLQGATDTHLSRFEEFKLNAERGFSPEENFLRTGWYYDTTEDKYKFEISDLSAKIKQKVLRPAKGVISDFLDHKELYEVYPEVAKIPVKLVYVNKSNTLGQFDPDKGLSINLAMFKDTRVSGDYPDLETFVKSVILHEVQHWVQEKEAFETGKSPLNEAVQDKALLETGLFSTELFNKGYGSLSGEEYQKLFDDLRFYYYQNSKGEVDARNVDFRSRTPTMANRLPLNTESIPLEKQLITKKDNNGKPYLVFVGEE